jgi:plastocyanin
MKKTILLLLVFAALGAALLATASSGARVKARAAPVKTVKLKDDYFSPKKVTIKKGSSIKWLWRGFNEHDVHVGGKNSGLKITGSYSHRFLHRGKFRVYCLIHEDEGMVMHVTVK